MKICIIQDRPVISFNNEYFRGSLTESEKYLQLCDSIIYCATEKRVDTINNKLHKIDKNKIDIRILKNNTLYDKLCISKYNITIIKKAIEDADVVVIKMPSFTVGRVANNIVKQKKCVIEVVGCAWDVMWYYDIRGKLLAPFCYIITKQIVKNASNVVYVTQSFLQKRYPNNKHTIGCSNVYIDDISDNILKNRLNKIQNIDNKIIKLATLGPIDIKFRGQQYVIKAISKLKEKGFCFHYFLIGGGNPTYLQKLSQKLGILDQIHFVGQVAHDKVNDILDDIDIYIHPSLAEGLPRALIEAMSRGLPALGSKTAGIPELLNKKYLFNKGNINDIYYILKTFTKEDMYIEAKRNFEFSKNYEYNILNEKRKQFYKNLI